MTDLKEFIFKTVKETSGVNDFVITEKTRLREDLEFDSLAVLTLADSLEEEFQVALDSDDLAIMPDTVGDVIKLIQSKINQK